MKINFESKPVCGDDDKYIKTKIKIYVGSLITNFHDKNMPKEKVPCKVLSSNTFRRMQYVQERLKTEKFIHDDLDKSESDGDSNDETESDIDNDEYDE